MYSTCSINNQIPANSMPVPVAVLGICKFLIALIIFYSVNANAAWNEEIVQDNTNFSFYNHSAVTVNNIQHVFSKGAYLYHSYLDSGKWVTEKIDDRLSFTGSSDEGVAATTGPNGKIHLIYTNSKAGDIKYAVGTTGNWTIVDTPLKVADSTGAGVGDLVVDSKGNVHVFFVGGAYDQSTGNIVKHIVHAVYDGVSWTQENIDNYGFSCGGVCEKISAVIDSSDRIHIIYNAGSGSSEELRYQTFLNGVWSSTVLATATDNSVYALNSTLVLDSSGNPMACYSTYTNQAYCASESTGVWSTSEVLVGGSTFTSCGFFATLMKDANGIVHGIRLCSGNMEFIQYQNGTWTAAGSITFVATHTPYVLDSTADATYVFNLKDFGNDAALQVYSLNAGVTAKSDVLKISRGYSGWTPNINYDSKSNIVYVTHDSRVYSERKKGIWSTALLANGNVDTNISDQKLPVAITSNGARNFFYNDEISDNKQVTLDINNVESVINDYLPEQVRTALPAASVVDASDNIHLMFVDYNCWCIKYATNKSGNWVDSVVYTVPPNDLETVNSANKLMPSSLALTIDNTGAFVAAFDESHADYSSNFGYDEKLVRIRGDGSTWIVDTVAEKTQPTDSLDSDYWSSPVIKLDKSGAVHMVYLETHCDAIFCYPAGISYGTDQSGTWEETRISSESYYAQNTNNGGLPGWDTGLSTDLSIDNSGNVFIAYVQGKVDNSPMNLPPETSTIRTVHLGSCMPVSTVAYDNYIAPTGGNVLIDTTFGPSVLGMIAFADTSNGELHTLSESPDVKITSCATATNQMNISVKNVEASSIQFTKVTLDYYVDNIYSVVSNNCQGSVLTPGSSCSILVNANLPAATDYTSNVDSTLYLYIDFNDGQPEYPTYSIDTGSLRPVPVDKNITSSGSGSGSGGMNSIFLQLLALYMSIAMWARCRS